MDDRNSSDDCYSSDFEDEPEPGSTTCTCKINLENDVSITAPNSLYSILNEYITTKWTANKKNNSLQFLNLPLESTLVSDILRTVLRKDIEKRNPCVKIQEKEQIDKTCSFKFNLLSEFNDEVRFRVPIIDSFVEKTRSQFYEVFAWIYDGLEWEMLQATVKDGFAEFCCCQLDSFGILIHSKRMSAIVNPLGTEIDIGDSCACILKFDKDCVKSNENFRYTVHTPDVEFSRFGYTSTRHVKHVSNKFNFEYDRAKFLKPIKVVVSLTNVPLRPENKSKVEVLLVGYKNGSASIVESMKKSADAIYSGSLHGYDGVSLAAVLKTKEDKISKTELTNELNLFYGSRILGSILVYFLKRNSSTLRLRVICCRTEQTKLLKIKKHQEGNFLIHKSENLFLTPYQRLKIRPAGCIGLKPGNGSHLWMLFLSVSSDNSLTFQVKINRIMGGSPNAILCFSTNTHSRNYTEITKIEFNLDSLTFHRNRHDPEENPSKEDTKIDNVKITKSSDLKSIEADVDQGASSTHCSADCKTVLSKTESKHSIDGGLILSNPTLARYEQ
ncbi:uncharacterized protein LOC127728384 [Mytilus californianus]|uniref:uncharacterized protein LOC127728384 n=1 Tax=Mytilus californianus TaxID=6549 RepID=UPI0022485806|nr:uncharacterized protein LOC127728384 [Mytilus californianus]